MLSKVLVATCILVNVAYGATTPSAAPSAKPSAHPSAKPSAHPSAFPSFAPSAHPSAKPSAHPSHTPSAPSKSPSTSGPSNVPTPPPSKNPTKAPSTFGPSKAPTITPTAPSTNPSVGPTKAPTEMTKPPTKKPSNAPSPPPSKKPSNHPSVNPTPPPSANPSTTSTPTAKPSPPPASSSPTAKPSPPPVSGSPTTTPTPPPSIEPTDSSDAPTAAPVMSDKKVFDSVTDCHELPTTTKETENDGCYYTFKEDLTFTAASIAEVEACVQTLTDSVSGEAAANMDMVRAKIIEDMTKVQSVDGTVNVHFFYAIDDMTFNSLNLTYYAETVNGLMDPAAEECSGVDLTAIEMSVIQDLKDTCLPDATYFDTFTITGQLSVTTATPDEAYITWTCDALGELSVTTTTTGEADDIDMLSVNTTTTAAVDPADNSVSGFPLFLVALCATAFMIEI